MEKRNATTATSPATLRVIAVAVRKDVPTPDPVLPADVEIPGPDPATVTSDATLAIAGRPAAIRDATVATGATRNPVTRETAAAVGTALSNVPKPMKGSDLLSEDAVGRQTPVSLALAYNLQIPNAAAPDR